MTPLSNPFKKKGAHQWRGVIEEYRHRLPVSKKTLEALAKSDVVKKVESVLHIESSSR